MNNYKKYIFYDVFFIASKPVEICHNLGVFSSLKYAQEMISTSHLLPGYSNYEIDNYKIIRSIVLCNSSVKKDSVKYLYHLYSEVDCGSYTEYRDYGYYYYKRLAIKDLNWIVNNTSYGKKNLKSFEIEKLEVNYKNNIWSEGFDLL